MSKQKTKTSGQKKKRQRAAVNNRFKLALAGLFLVGFLIVSLVILSTLKQSYHQVTVPPAEPPDLSLLMQDIQVELESAMLRSGASLDRLKVAQQGTAWQLAVDGIFPDEQILAELSLRLHRLAPDLELLVSDRDNRIVLQKGSKLLFTLIFSPDKYTPQRHDKPRVAIIMDDLGRDVSVAKQAIALDYQVTMSVLPNERHASEIATLAHRRGREVMIHIPMEPEGYPAANPGEGALFVDLSTEEIQRRFMSYLDRIPYAVGGNNHMGSKFTTDRQGMHTVLELMRREGLFFVDSRTTGSSIALAEARRLKIPSTARDVFLDNDADVERIARQIRKLVVLAGKKGSAVGICHPHSETLAALQQQLPLLNRDGIVVVPVSQLTKR
ncbi:MAG TPA: divergent polysaccharide deacetylase family protein [Geothermobacteraceae bacterium]|nr:divergent polysaccharide deacetylase family protein [Geothermobacteraceae bacterium]